MPEKKKSDTKIDTKEIIQDGGGITKIIDSKIVDSKVKNIEKKKPAKKISTDIKQKVDEPIKGEKVDKKTKKESKTEKVVDK